MGGNCVIGYIQNFDLEGEHGVVVRGIGTSACIYKHTKTSTANTPTSATQNSTKFVFLKE